MATYNKRGGKRYNSRKRVSNKEIIESTTAEVFESLDSGATKTEKFVAKYQSLIFSCCFNCYFCIFYLAYETFVLEPKNEDAITELNQVNIILTLHSIMKNRTFFNSAINGMEENLVLDIIQNYENTPSSNLAIFSTNVLLKFKTI